VDGDRPPPTTDEATLADVPKLAGLTLSAAAAGNPMQGAFSFRDAQGDVAELIVQVLGAQEHYVFEIPAADIGANRVDLGVVRLAAGFATGTRLVYFGLRDEAQHVGSYLTGTLVVGADGALDICALPAVQLLGHLPNQDTSVYTEINGLNPDYREAQTNGEWTQIASGRLFMELGGCAKLLLAGDEAGTLPVGWDDILVVEYREAPGEPIAARWYYGNQYVPGLLVAETDEEVPKAIDPTVSGDVFGIPNGAPFGHEPKAIDLMEHVPADAQSFELNVFILDHGSWGSTSDVWILPEK